MNVFLKIFVVVLCNLETITIQFEILLGFRHIFQSQNIWDFSPKNLWELYSRGTIGKQYYLIIVCTTKLPWVWIRFSLFIYKNNLICNIEQ